MTKRPEDVIKYPREELLKFRELCMALPAELEFSNIEIVMNQRNREAMERGCAPPPNSQPRCLSSRALTTEMDAARELFASKPEQEATETSEVGDWRARNEAGESAVGWGSHKDEGSWTKAKQQQAKPGSTQQHQQADRSEPASHHFQQHKHHQPHHPQQQQGEEGYHYGQMAKASNPWRPRGKAEGDERVLRTVKGILNKITPEKFDSLIKQLVNVGINSPELLQKVISQLFDKAVLEPTFCSLYAQCCVALSERLPQFQPRQGEDKPITFRRVLLNTCHDEFEGASKARSEAASISDPSERENEEQKAKIRTLGNIKLIAELYKKGLLQEKILHRCASELLGTSQDARPEEINVEALCVLLETCGKDVDANTKRQKAIDGYFDRLKQLSEDRSLSSRIRFRCMDVIELREKGWEPRREQLEAKKLGEIHAEAQHALGIPGFAPAANSAASLQGPEQSPSIEENLFPDAPVGKGKAVPVASGKDKVEVEEGKYSALFGGYQPPSAAKRLPTQEERLKQQQEERRRAVLDSPWAEPKRKAADEERSKGEGPAEEEEEEEVRPEEVVRAEEEATRAWTWEEAEDRLKKAVQEYLEAGDAEEASRCVAEVDERAPEGNPHAVHVRTVDLLTADALESSSSKCAEMAATLIARLHSEREVGADAIKDAIRRHSDNIEDLALDVPLAPDILASLLAPLLLPKRGVLTMHFVRVRAPPPIVLLHCVDENEI